MTHDIPAFPVFVALWNETQRLTTPDLHFEIAGWLSDRWNTHDRELLLMAFRNSGKSTLVGLKPKAAEEWASDRFTVSRAGTHRDPSMLAKGIVANVTGSRADVVICDDVEVPNTCDTPEKREALRERLDEIDFVLSPDGLRLFVGTPHTYHSIYAENARAELGETRPYLGGFSRLVLPIVDEQGDSRWPERFPPSRIRAIEERAGPAKYRSQMMLQPADVIDARLDPSLMRPYEAELSYREGNGEPVLTLGGKRMVSVSCFWDPSFGRPGRGDGCVIAAVFTDADGDYWLHGIEYLTHQPALAGDIDEATQLCRQAVSFVRRHFVPAVTIETNGVGRFLPGLFRREVARAGLACSVLEHASSRAKSARILEAFDAVLAAGRLHISRRARAGRFVTEMREWRPDGNTPDDGLDAVAGCLLAEPVRLARHERTRNARAAAMTRWRPGFDPVRLTADFEV